jgi:hypothetical protein
MSIDPPPDGEVEQSARVELSEGRSLELSVAFHQEWPRVQAIYHDPGFAAVGDQFPAVAGRKIAGRPFGLRDRVWSLFARLGGMLRPVPVTVVVAVLLIATFAFLRLRAPSVSATELLRRAEAFESVLLADKDQAVRRVLKLEDRREGEIVSERRVEVWTGGGRKARRVYDERGLMVAGEWMSEDGSRTVYRLGFGVETFAANSQSSPVEEVWRMEPSAKAFNEIVPDAESARVEHEESAYVISYAAGDGPGRFVSATLRIRKSDYRPVEQNLQLRRSDGIHQYRIVESSFDRHAANEIAPRVFLPDREIVSGAGNATGSAATGATPPTVESANPARLVDLHVEALYRLHSAGACLREQMDVRRTGGVLRVQAIVGDEKRRGELVGALGAVAESPDAQIEVLTTDEAIRQQMNLPARPVARRVEIRKGRIPAYDDLRRHFEGRGSGEDLNRLIERFASRMMEHSRAALLHAWALKQLAEEFSAEEMAMLESGEQAKLRQIMRDHARAFEAETAALDEGLRPAFAPAVDGSEAAADPSAGESAEKVFEAASFHEKIVRQAFAISPDGTSHLLIKTETFWSSLRSARKLARIIE